MSSTVTTSTIAVMTTAAGLAELAATFTLIAVLLLAVLLVTKEISAVGKGTLVRRLGRGLDIAIVPLIATFLLLLGLRSFG